MNRTFTAGVFALATLASTSAFSQAYVSGAVGGSHASIDCSGADSCSNNATAAKAIVGYDFGNRLAVEGMIVSLGSPHGVAEGVRVDIKSSFWGLGVAYRPDFGNNWSGVARLGAAFTTSRIEGSQASVDANGGVDLFQIVAQSYHSTSAYAGLGVAYAVAKDVKIEADLDSTRISVFSGTDRQTARVIDYTVGVTFQF